MVLFMSGAMAQDTEESAGGDRVCDDGLVWEDDLDETGDGTKCDPKWWCGESDGVTPSSGTATQVLLAGKYTFTGNDNDADYDWTIKTGSGATVATSSDRSITYDFLGCGKPYSVYYTATEEHEDDTCVVTGCVWVWITCKCIQCPSPESFCVGSKPDPMPTMIDPWDAYTYKWQYKKHGTSLWLAGGEGLTPSIDWPTLAVGKYDMRVLIYYNGALHKVCPPRPFRYYIFEVYPLPVAGHTIAAA